MPETAIFSEFVCCLLLGIGGALIFLEVFIPSGGIIGIVALASMGLGIYGFFDGGHPLLGSMSAIGSTIFVVFMFSFMLRRISLTETQDTDAFTSVDETIAGLDGKSGVTKSALRPAGVALIDGKRIDVVAARGFIEKDKEIKVIETSGNRVVVKELLDEDIQSMEPGTGNG